MKLVLALSAMAAQAAAAELQADLLVAGGTESGWAAAIQAARMGVRSIVLVNDIEWLGGQFTAEAVAAIDENRGVKNQVPFARSGLFAEVMERIERWNLEKYGHRSPGNSWTARTTARPAEAEKIFREMVERYVRSGQIRIVNRHYPVSADVSGDGRTLQAVRFRPTETKGEDLIVRARITIDATDWGDVIQASGAAFEYGPDPRSRYDEPSAPEDPATYPVTDMNPITYSLVIEEAGGEAPIPRPAHFDDRRYFLTSNLTEKDYKALGWPFPQHRPFTPPWTPLTGTFYQGDNSVYSQRRIVDSQNHEVKGDQRDVLCLVWTLQDYPLDVLPAWVVKALEANQPGSSRRNIVTMTREQRQIVFEDAKQHSLGMLYHLQTTVHERMADRSHSFRRFRLSPEFGTPDHAPPKPYVRESLRLKALYMMREQDARNFDSDADSENWYMKARKGSMRDAFARQMYYDGVAVWQFVYDFHMTARMFLNADSGGPWASYFKPGRSWTTQSDRALLPLRSLIPRRIDGLLGAQKNLGYSSIVSSAVRLHDQSIAVGQAAGAAAAVALSAKVAPRAIPSELNLLGRVQDALCSRLDGGEPLMLWPYADLEPKHPAFEAVNLLAVRQAFPPDRFQVNFQPDAPATPEWVRAVVDASLARKQAAARPAVPQGALTRGEFARRWWQRIRTLPDRALTRLAPGDADGDGTPDLDDPAPYDRNDDNLLDILERKDAAR